MKDRARFYVVYVREEHPTVNGERPPAWTRAPRADQPKTLEERRARAREFARAEGIVAPILVDTMDDRVASAYDALPDRAFVVGENGRLAYVGSIGPAGFHVEEIEPALRAAAAAAQSARAARAARAARRAEAARGAAAGRLADGRPARADGI